MIEDVEDLHSLRQILNSFSFDLSTTDRKVWPCDSLSFLLNHWWYETPPIISPKIGMF